ncbi:hypothetical protein DCS_04377 [Drechmeria coniospora]|uniref:Glycosyl transferase CAP10 domain-containing protein n=1 Tax=Drechmeria coniospora TaxID=98403 RepID=A0A151GJV3_DRECN|nr:hypothetical protein DCS_04377 [Drechmeria coniospora]KYK57368.1 hypothetical protein DCS_04377 [Drechmeria coniospora]ODA79265.1 hypothetical protein RJ55_04858 [Drechmeria coniospora]
MAHIRQDPTDLLHALPRILAMRRFRALLVVALLTLLALLCFRPERWHGSALARPNALAGWMRKSLGPWRLAGRPVHPIDELLLAGRRRSQELLARRSTTLDEAASRYRKRRGRHPPPGFDAWFAQAQADGAVVVEDFFDRIHHDLNPFWAVDAKRLRLQANRQKQVIRVRNGSVDFVTDDPNREPWIQLWTELVREMTPHLPDLDMAINFMDETRILVPWEAMSKYVEAERRRRTLVDPKTATSTHAGLADVDGTAEPAPEPTWITAEANKYWDHLRAACPPDSPGRELPALPSFNVTVDYPSRPMPYAHEGFVRNFTEAQDPCLQPHLRGMHGTFVESVSMSTTHDLMPLFGGSKLPQNNEILIPGAMYLSDRAFYSGGETRGPAWSLKREGLVWRGTASGGRNKVDNWWHFHRHRWVQMMNGTTVAAVEAGDVARGPTFRLPPRRRYSARAQLESRLGPWLESVADVGFVNLECHPYAEVEVGTGADKHMEMDKTCRYTTPFMAVQPSLPMERQYEYKFLPDVDGNSFSARWRAFLHSTSMPLKATIYAEWHDDRIVPWAHFVPFDNSYGDVYAVVDYFLDGRDEEAQRIAEEGKKWVEMVYRREDMKLYVWRLLLEYARVVDDKRDRLAFVGDLL